MDTANKSKVAKMSQKDQQPKMCKIQFQDSESSESDEEEFAEIENLSCSRALPMTPSSHNNHMKNNSVKIKFRLAGANSSSDEEAEVEDDELQRKLSEIFGPNPGSVTPSNSRLSHHQIPMSNSENFDCGDQDSNSSSNSSLSNFQFSIEKSPSQKMMKIHYQEYHKRILTAEMKNLMHQSYLNDVEFVCKDGNVYANSLILGNFNFELK